MVSEKLFGSNNLFRIFLFLLIIVSIYCLINKEKFSNNKIQFSLETSNNLKYDYKYDIIKIDEQSNTIFKLAKDDEQLMNQIRLKLVEIYGEIKTNPKLKNFLKFNNLINEDGMPIFINESPDVLLFNEIKILLITLPDEKKSLLPLSEI